MTSTARGIPSCCFILEGLVSMRERLDRTSARWPLGSTRVHTGAARPRTYAGRGSSGHQRRDGAGHVYRAIGDAELMVVPGTSHGLLVEKPELCNDVILRFLTTDPVRTLAPIRRASAHGAEGAQRT